MQPNPVGCALQPPCRSCVPQCLPEVDIFLHNFDCCLTNGDRLRFDVSIVHDAAFRPLSIQLSSCRDSAIITMSSAKRRCDMYSPFIHMPCPFQSNVLKTSSNALVNSFGDITSPCLTPRCSWIGLVLWSCTWTVIVAALYRHLNTSI
ncbi:hypothetical protein JYU34_000119 [Plutella xylostella]|uniref:Uncharacterized protein n=1 Tax=Plutella xylostella TaxID=51655 RepID=A0ABQ7R6X8_PLUXY|nr:hypothetical protein JYU34_000119 [Plutella xylostella]